MLPQDGIEQGVDDQREEQPQAIGQHKQECGDNQPPAIGAQQPQCAPGSLFCRR